MWAFDLWDFESVKQNASQILELIEEGDLPWCAWQEQTAELFRSWTRDPKP